MPVRNDMSPPPQCADPKLIEALTQVRAMADDIGEIKDVLREVARALTQIAVIETRQQQVGGEITRLFKVTDDHGERIGALEKAQPMQQQTSAWVNKAITVVITAVLTAVLGLVLIKATVPAAIPAVVAPR